jgi:methionyl-tRNA synthetase
MQEENKVEEKNPKTEFITIEDFLKVEMKLGTVISVQEVEGSDKLYKLEVDFGEFEEIESEGGITENERRIRTVFSGIRKFVTPDDLLNKQFPFVTNLAPRKIMGSYSEAMKLACGGGEEGFTLFPSQVKLPNGTSLK